jgi:glycosyltransferase involved in cell wall biosynthesis
MNILEFNPIIILMPVYEDAKVLVILLEELKKELGTEVYIVAVDDGSINQPLDIDILKKINLSGAIIKLNKNPIN